MKTIAILAALMVLALAKNPSSVPYVQTKTVGAKGVEINDITFDDIASIFEFNNATDDVFEDALESVEKLKVDHRTQYVVRPPRLHHNIFTVHFKLESDVAIDAVFKFFLGPKYDSNGYPLSIEENGKEFVELDMFVQRLSAGQNNIERFYQSDSPLSLRLPEIVLNGGLNLVVYITNRI